VQLSYFNDYQQVNVVGGVEKVYIISAKAEKMAAKVYHSYKKEK